MDDLSNLSPEEILELQRKNCIFCKIIKKEIPSNEIHSDDKVMIVLDINPAHEGHSLVLPKEHYQILPQMSDDLIGYLFLSAKRTSRSLLKALALQGTTIFVANGAIAGQKAPHFMTHVIPRKKNDLLFQIPKSNVDEKELTEIHQKLSARIASLTGKAPPEPPKQIENKTEEEPKKEEKPPEEVKDEPKEEPKKEEEQQPEKEEKKDVDIDKISGLFT
jgi:histidine triad (HIT) family protein